MFRLKGKQEELLSLHPFILHSPSTEGLMTSYIKANSSLISVCQIQMFGSNIPGNTHLDLPRNDTKPTV